MPTSLFEPGADDVLYLVDVSGYVFRAYHAVAPLTGPTGEATHAVFGTVNMLERLMRQCRPKRFAVAMDSRTVTFRKQRYPAYKANRPKPPDDLKHQMRRVGELIDAFGVQVLQQDGEEADDLIASAVVVARLRGLRVVIVSADKDLMQLVTNDVLMWDTMRDRVYGPEEVVARFGVRLDQIRDFLALTGDSSDNIPGVPSVGPKTAQELLTTHDTLAGVYEHLDQVPRKKLRETLEAHRADAFLSQELVTLRAECDSNPGANSWSFAGRDAKRLRALYAELGFARHLAELDKELERQRQELDAKPIATAATKPAPTIAATTATEPTQERPSGHANEASPHGSAEVSVEIITSERALQDFADAARRAGILALALATAGKDPMRADVIGIGMCADASRAVYLPFGHRYVGVPAQLTWQAALAVLGPLLGDLRVKKLGHDVKDALISFGERGIAVSGLDFDVLLAHYLLDPEAAHDLERVASANGAPDVPTLESVTNVGRMRIGIDEVEVDRAAQVFARRAQACVACRPALEQRLEEDGLLKLLREVELPLAGCLARIERHGICLDTEHLATLGERVGKQLEELERDAHRVAGKAFNVNSPRQLETLLFDELGLKPQRRTKTSRSTDAETLEALADEHPLPRVVLEIRQLSKLKGTYIDALPSLVNPKTQRLHTRWAQAVAATGRLSSHDPNLQNIPIRSDLGRSIRDAFYAPDGFLLVSADYSQVELRVLAHLSQDPLLIEAFQSGQDVHLRTAMEIFEVPADAVDAELRRRAKAVNFGVVYGQGDSGLAKSLGISKADAGAFIAAYFRRYAGVRQFMDATLEHARAGGAVQSVLGRRRLLPDIRSSNRARRLAAERIAMNMPIQGTAADILKLAMLKLTEPVAPGARLLLSVHDELVFEVPKEHVETASERIAKAMAEAYPLSVPLVVDVGHGKTWSQAH